MPLVLFLHGSGERGTDNEAQLLNGAAELLGEATARLRFPCFFVLPQCPKEARWVDVDWGAKSHSMPAQPSLPLSLCLDLLRELLLELSVDADRVYLIGISMGGYGVWDLLGRCPQEFAAAVPICGGGDETQAERMQKVPIWAFHGALDEVVPPSRSRRMIEALRRVGATPRYTEFPTVGHKSWVSAFAEPQLLPWLFAQRRGQVPSPHG
jgi:predicted peptidase